MSTRCQVVVKDSYKEMWFYRHSDGYPEGTLPALKKFMLWVKEGRIRDNVEQSCGWLVLIGAEEYNYKFVNYNKKVPKTTEELFNPSDWKCGAFEPCPCRKEHGDIEFLYTLDIKNLTITVKDLYEEKVEVITNFE